jgi:cytochrome P450
MIDVYDLTSEHHRRDPFPLYARMRTEAPVLWSERLHCWFLSRYRDCLDVFRDAERFGVDRQRLGTPVPEQATNLQNMDRPAHTPVRNLFVAAYRAQDFAGLARRARQHADRLLDQLMQRPEVDLMAEYGSPLGLEVTCEFLGVERPDVSSFSAMADAVVQSFDGGFFNDLRKPGEEARARLSELIESWNVRSPGGGKGFIGYLLDRQEAEQVSRRIVFNSVRVGLLAGYTAVTSALGNVLKAVFERDVPLERFRDDAGNGAGADLALEEMFRYEGPVQGMMRLCYEDVEIGGQRIHRGQAVTLLIGAANRDPEPFQCPDDLVLDRAPNPHLAFGWGMHACIGGSLAKLVLGAALAQLARRAPRMRLVQPLVPKRQVSHRAPQRVLVAWE